MENKDYYSILNVDKKSTEDEIKKSYKKLALQYHPDKNSGNEEACEKFKIISEAYSVIGNKEKRDQYDLLGTVEDNFGTEDPFSVFNEIFRSHIGNFMNMKYENDINLNNIFNNISGKESSLPFGNFHIRVHTFPTDVYQNTQRIDDEDFEDFENNIEENESNPIPQMMGSIFENLFKMNKKKDFNDINDNNNKDNFINKKNITKVLYEKPDDIVYNINVSFSDIYNEKTKKITIMRKRKKNGIYIDKKKKIEIPIYGKEIILEEEGDELKNYKNRGNVLINIFNENDVNFKRLNEYDMLTFVKIELNQIYSIFFYNITLPNKEKINIKSIDLISNKDMIQKIIGKGIPYKNENGEKLYGNLFVMYKVNYPTKLEELKNISEYIIKENEKENEKIINAENCKIEEILYEI